MPSCTFFGHRECPETIRAALKEEIEKISERGVSMFYVGNNGRFDEIVRTVLRELGLSYAVVLAYLPEQAEKYQDLSDTMYPEGLENVPPRFAIAKRNRWMIENSDFVITYVRHDWGGAAKYAEMAERKGKTVVNIAER